MLTNGTTATAPVAINPKRAPNPSHQSADQLHLEANGTNGLDPDSLQYLKPASDEQTVAWSEGASDLLF